MGLCVPSFFMVFGTRTFNRIIEEKGLDHENVQNQKSDGISVRVYEAGFPENTVKIRQNFGKKKTFLKALFLKLTMLC